MRERLRVLCLAPSVLSSSAMIAATAGGDTTDIIAKAANSDPSLEGLRGAQSLPGQSALLE